MRRLTLATCAAALTAAALGLGTPRTAPVHAVGVAAGRPQVAVARLLHTNPLHHSTDQSSSNWSGWVDTAGGFNHVSGTFVVPTVNVTPDDRYASTWVGIGGDPSPDLIQAGVEEDSVGGQAQYYAWTEILPEPESQISLAVRPGDRISIDISSQLFALWTIVVTNETTGQSQKVSTPYVSTGLTAEWIHEAPTVGGLIANLAHTSNAVFDLGSANGKPVSQGSPQSIDMLDSNNVAIAEPSPLDADGDGFQVADGSATPPPPAS